MPHTLEEVKRKYANVFDRLGKFPGKPYHINLNPDIPPKWVPCRPVPIHDQEEFKKTTDQYATSWGPSAHPPIPPWISSYVNVKSEDTKGRKKFHICLDLANLNETILHEPFFTHTANGVYCQAVKSQDTDHD